MRASIYCRISRDREGSGLGVARQEADCRTLAATLGYEIVTVHTDNDVSAYSGKPRPGYTSLLAEVRGGDVDAVIAWHTDRLHRSPVELEQYVAACEQHGVKTQTVKAGELDLSTASGLMVARMLGAAARYEVHHSIERIVTAKKEAAEAGRWRGGRRPFGYEKDGMTVCQDEADKVLEATNALLAGVSLRGLVTEWNAAGIQTTSGNGWTPNSLRKILRRWRNAGLIEVNGYVIGAAQWPAIVPETQLRALRDMLDNPARRTNQSNARRWLGSGLYRCECGSTVIMSASNSARAYRCRDGCHQLSRRQREVDEFVSEVIVRRLRSDDVADVLRSGEDDVLHTLEAEAVALRSRLDSLAGLFADGHVDARQLAEGSRELRVRLEDAQTKIASVYSGTALAGVAGAPDPGAAWLDAPLDRQRAVLDALAVVTLMRGAAGRPPGWQPGQSYFRPDLVSIEWRQ